MPKAFKKNSNNIFTADTFTEPTSLLHRHGWTCERQLIDHGIQVGKSECMSCLKYRVLMSERVLRRRISLIPLLIKLLSCLVFSSYNERGLEGSDWVTAMPYASEALRYLSNSVCFLQLIQFQSIVPLPTWSWFRGSLSHDSCKHRAFSNHNIIIETTLSLWPFSFWHKLDSESVLELSLDVYIRHVELYSIGIIIYMASLIVTDKIQTYFQISTLHHQLERHEIWIYKKHFGNDRWFQSCIQSIVQISVAQLQMNHRSEILLISVPEISSLVTSMFPFKKESY